jgi:hypothetical protein
MARQKFDPRPTIRVVTTMPSHPKIAGLSDAAFRALVTLWCYCGEHHTDAKVPVAVVRKEVRPKQRAELVNAGLMVDGDPFEMHDFLDHNRASEEIESFRQGASESGAKGAHLRWHVPQRKSVPECQFCVEAKGAIKNA